MVRVYIYTCVTAGADPGGYPVSSAGWSERRDPEPDQRTDQLDAPAPTAPQRRPPSVQHQDWDQ